MNIFCKIARKVGQSYSRILDTRVIVELNVEEKAFVSPIFTVPKKDGSVRMILILKKFNEVKYRHFRMDTLESIIKLMHRTCFMASVDLQHTYYSIPVAPEEQMSLQFEYKGHLV